MKKKIALLGSTGSIGTQTLEVVQSHPDELEVVGLAAGRNIQQLERQIRRFNPLMAAVADRNQGDILEKQIDDLDVIVLKGDEGVLKLASELEYDLQVMAMVGTSGLLPALAAVCRGIDMALATKEVLVAAGEIVMNEAKKYQGRIIPVDSEHNAVFQCLQGEKLQEAEKIILTASGGPFLSCSKEDMGLITPRQALKHPNWSMGKKISVDSATMINKGLEVLEAKWLFAKELADIEVLVHPQSIVHSMVQFFDSSVIAQLGLPDMKTPIQYALLYPERGQNTFKRLDLAQISMLTFEKPDMDRFPGLEYAYRAGYAGGTMPAVFNAANEAAVALFLQGRTAFLEIAEICKEVMDQHDNRSKPSLEEILEADGWARRAAECSCLVKEN